MRFLLVAIALHTRGAISAPTNPTNATSDEPTHRSFGTRAGRGGRQAFRSSPAPTGGRQESVAPIERPLLLFGDDPRNLTRGILWGWGAGRPVAVAELWRGRAEECPYRRLR